MLNSALCSRLNKCGRVDSSSFLKERLSLAQQIQSLISGVGDRSGPERSSVSRVMMRGHQSAGLKNKDFFSVGQVRAIRSVFFVLFCFALLLPLDLMHFN